MPISKMTPKEYAAALEQIGLTNYEFAKLLGVSDRAARAWVNGEYPIQPPIIALLRLAARLKVSPARLAKLIIDPI